MTITQDEASSLALPWQRHSLSKVLETPLRSFMVRYGKDAEFEVMATSADEAWDQHFDSAHAMGKGLSVRPAEVREGSAKGDAWLGGGL